MKESFSICKAAFKKAHPVESLASIQPIEYEQDTVIAWRGTSPAYALASCPTLWESAFAVRKL
jgi:hypothetical protein